jgi:hypothetical protein
MNGLTSVTPRPEKCAVLRVTSVRPWVRAVAPIPPESPYQRPQVVRSLYEAATALERVERFERRKAQMPAKTGESWSEDEDRKLLAAFDAGRAAGTGGCT